MLIFAGLHDQKLVDRNSQPKVLERRGRGGGRGGGTPKHPHSAGPEFLYDMVLLPWSCL